MANVNNKKSASSTACASKISVCAKSIALFISADGFMFLSATKGFVFMLALACDHGGYELMQKIREFLELREVIYSDFGTFSKESCDYPEIAARAANAISSGDCDKGIFICSTGIGISIAANKTPGVRAALCTDTYMAEMTRRHNDANVLALGAHVTTEVVALRIVEVFLNTMFEGGRHARRVDMLNAMDVAKKNTQ